MGKSGYVVSKTSGPGYKVSKEIPFAEWTEPAFDEPCVDLEVAKVTMKDLHLPHFFMRTSQGHFTRDALLVNTGGTDLDMIGSCLFPRGRFCTELSGKHYVDSVDGTQNFKYDPNNEFKHFIAAHTPFQIVHFSVHPSHFLNYLPDDEKWADDVKEKISCGSHVMGTRSASITLAQQRILQNILECPLTGAMATHMMEASIIQLMLLQLHELFKSERPTKQQIEARDKEIVNSVKDYLLKNFLEDHSLESLARHFGTNTNKLMILFKTAFGKSIFEFIGELRMDYAHNMIRKEGLSVIEVSRLTGYKNANHFSTAFKRRFGVSPSHVTK